MFPVVMEDGSVSQFRLLGVTVTIGSPDESGGMTIDELLDDIDSVLADHRGER